MPVNYLKRVLGAALVLAALTAASCGDAERKNSALPAEADMNGSAAAARIKQIAGLHLDQRAAAIDSFLTLHPASPIIENKLICLYWYGNAEKALVNSDITDGWNKPEAMNVIQAGDNKFFYKFFTLPADARVDYIFVIDGKEITDPRNPVITPSGYTPHSQIAMPDFVTSTLLEYAENISHGSVDSLIAVSGKTKLPQREVKIYKPAGYDTLSNQPLVIVNDGYKAISYSSFINVLDNSISRGEIEPLVTVFIDFVEGDQDYFINKTDDYSLFISGELIPELMKRYKISADPQRRLIMGISAGGHASIITALKHPDAVLNAAGQSTTVTEELLELLEKQTKAPEYKSYKFYIDTGRYDLHGTSPGSFLYANQRLNKKLTGSGYLHQFTVVNDGHQWANWRERTGEILKYFFPRQ